MNSRKFQTKGFLAFIQTELHPNPFGPHFIPHSYKFGRGVAEMLRQQDQGEKDRLREEFWLDQGIIPPRNAGE